MKKMVVALGLVASTVAIQAGENEGSFFLKLPLTSFHFGDAEGYTFNQQNFGVGIGYEHKRHIPGIGDTTMGYSIARFVDSYHCTATNLQVRALKEFGIFAFGVSVNLAHKCVRPYTRARTVAAPLLTSAWNLSESVRITLDGFPPVTKQYGVGFVGVSLDVDF